jgi:hypothetical protein
MGLPMIEPQRCIHGLPPKAKNSLLICALDKIDKICYVVLTYADCHHRVVRGMGFTPFRKGTIPVEFTPGQLREIVGLSVETFRHWKRVLPPFANRRGYAPCFSVGDLLAASILRRLTDNCGVRVGHLKNVSIEISHFCNTSSWPAMEGRILVVDISDGTCRMVRNGSASGQDIAILCPLDPILTELRDELLQSKPLAAQSQLMFPPAVVRSDSQRRGRRA